MLFKDILFCYRDKDSLWHKTDQLVTEHKRKVGEKWQDNAQVSNCLQCKAEFSIFVRRVNSLSVFFQAIVVSKCVV